MTKLIKFIDAGNGVPCAPYTDFCRADETVIATEKHQISHALSYLIYKEKNDYDTLAEKYEMYFFGKRQRTPYLTARSFNAILSLVRSAREKYNEGQCKSIWTMIKHNLDDFNPSQYEKSLAPDEFKPTEIDESIDIYGSGDALRDAREYVSAIESAVEYASQTLQRLDNHIDRMQAVRPLATSIPFGSADRGTVATYIRRKNGGLLNLEMWTDTFTVAIPESIYNAVPELEQKCYAVHCPNTDHTQYLIDERNLTPIARKYPKELSRFIHRLYFAYDALRRIGEYYRECKDIEKAIKDYEAGVGISE